MLVDSHCHLDFPDLAADEAGVLARARAAGVGRFLTISTRVRRNAALQAIAARHNDVFFTVGTHPHHAAEEASVTTSEIVAISGHPRCVGIGEAGLDYHYDRSPRDVQERVFRSNIAAARETELPLIIHARDADDDMIRILNDEMGEGTFKAVLHCFTSTEKLARTGIDLGFFVSFSGVLTFKKSEELRRIARIVPLERLLVETDAPYLSPEPYRGKRNEPAFVVETARVLASTCGMTFDALCELTTANFHRLFDQVTVGAPTLATPVSTPAK
ncbi:MAG: TatD family hydrolase [Hyphomicrobiales bacterium]|nr:TatD family hydrolase [Hyphomicrobiales bacterium]MBV9111803.1 TatD family hydrolase [Hyphomicrobiales bacterium]MBV9519833.1 TatD family hydrolase [Hyphomicrobiales bacterium]